MTWICKAVDGVCYKRESLGDGGSGATGTGGGVVAIAASVGLNGVNGYADVVTIQDALNRVPARQGGAVPPLVIDGLCGPKTRGAIQTFQLQHFGWKGADSLIEPFKQTIAKINEILGPEPMLPDLGAPIHNAMSWVLRARYTIDLASSVLESEDSSDRQTRMRLLNRHFELDSVASKRQTFEMIRTNYARMSQVFQRPGGLWGSAAFERDPMNLEYRSYTYWRGYFRSGKWHYENGRKIYLDSIYLGRRFDELDRDKRTFVIIHELAHFVGSPQHIDDFAYNADGAGVRVKHLSPHLKSLNAENYANFALDASTGREMLII
jgi:hypothetical protein